MNENRLVTTGEDMAEDDYAYFMAAMKYKVTQTKTSQRDLASKTATSYQWLNAIYKRRLIRGKEARASADLQRTIAEVLGYGWIEFLQLGKRLILEHLPIEQQQDDRQAEPPKPKERHSASIPGVDAKYIAPTDMLAAFSHFIGQYQANHERLKYWQEIFEYLPVATLVLKDGVVYNQNIRSRNLEKITGKPFCDSCEGKDCENKDVCPVNISTITARASSGYKLIKNVLYKLDVEFIRYNGAEYLIILATEAHNDAVPFNRRANGDRRKAEETI